MPAPTAGLTRRASAWRLAASAVAAAAVLGLAACSSDTNVVPTEPVVDPGPDTGGTSTTPTLSGIVVKGPVSGATVKAYALNANGTMGALLGSGPTDSTGAFSFRLSGDPAGPVLLLASGGTYLSESDGATVPKTSDLIALVVNVGSSDVGGIVISPLSDLASARARKLQSGGQTVSDAVSAALTLVGGLYGIDAALLPTLVPKFDRASLNTPAYVMGLVLGSLDTCDKALPAGLRGALFQALSADLSDGVFDGKQDGAAITVGTGTVLGSTAGTSDFLSCVSSYTTTGKAVTDAGITVADLGTTVNQVRTAVVNSPATPISTGLSAGSSGAISTLAYGGRQWIFIAARSQGVVAVDVTDPTALAPTIKKYSSLTTNFGGREIGGVVPLIGADHPQLLVYAYGSKHVALINADTGAVEYEADLPLAATSTVSFSGGSAYIAGAIPDTARDGVWLATADGYRFFNRATRVLEAAVAIASPAELAENVGGDITHNLLFAANYEPGVQLVDLNTNASYYFGGSAFTTTFPRLYSPDGGAVDSQYQVGIITNEDSPDVGFINLRTATRTTVTTGRNILAPAAGGAVAVDLGTPTISGSAVDSDSHLVLFMAGYSNDIAVGRLQDPASVAAGATWQGLTDWRYSRNLSGYSYARDPHAVAVIRNLSNGKSYGYLLHGGNRKLFQVDMQAMLTAPAQGTTGDAAHQLAADPVASGFVTNFGW